MSASLVGSEMCIRDRPGTARDGQGRPGTAGDCQGQPGTARDGQGRPGTCLLYTSDAADDM
eukprot:1331303-Alexandrium_andersonii.AAC.1